MALKKEITLDNGIVTSYHRIVSINKVTNNTTIIEIASYINEEKRQEEAEALRIGQELREAVPMNIFIHTTYINKEYNENESIQDMYAYLKTTNTFENALDV